MTAQVEVWLSDLENGDSERRTEARHALINYSGDISDLLINMMMEENGRRSWEAAIVLSQRKDSRALIPFTHLLTSKHPTLGQVAAETLAQYGCTYIDHLLTALPDATALTQLTIIKSLATIGDPCAIDPLVRLLNTAESPSIIHLIIRTLVTLGAVNALPDILKFADHADHHVQKSVRYAQQVFTHTS